MANKINNNELKGIGFYDIEVLKEAGMLAKKLIKRGELEKDEVLDVYRNLMEHPDKYLTNGTFGTIASLVKEKQPFKRKQMRLGADAYDLKPVPGPYEIYGEDQIEPSAREQMNVAMKLPVSAAGALMPDAHHGYGLPIGGVLATSQNAVIPYAVGVDIACRMCLSVYDIEGSYVDHKKDLLKSYVLNNTHFGLDMKGYQPLPDEVFDLPGWNETKLIRSLRGKAGTQVGSSGTGNHFVEWGVLELTEESKDLKLPKGKYLALLSHSGSRGFGAGIANHYSKLAMEKTKLPKEAQHLAWLDMDTEEGQEYWIGMNLAGEYASANHHQIHRRMAKALGVKPVAMVENHHNFAWKETLPDGTPVIVHRKGATPAGKGVLGIIPGSSGQPGFVVSGKGNAASLQSASHGAGRLMSRSRAMSTLDKKEVKAFLAEKGVTMIGGDLDEAPMVYKDIHGVIAAQQDLVDVLAKFTPRIVRMADPDRRRGSREG